MKNLNNNFLSLFLFFKKINIKMDVWIWSLNVYIRNWYLGSEEWIVVANALHWRRLYELDPEHLYSGRFVCTLISKWIECGELLFGRYWWSWIESLMNDGRKCRFDIRLKQIKCISIERLFRFADGRYICRKS